MATTYENVPVFRSGTGFGPSLGPEALVGLANVENEDDGSVTITIKTKGDNLPEFLAMGKLKSFEINTYVDNVDREAAKDWWAKQP